MTRADLPPGHQACQAAHAAIDFTFAHPEVARGWHESSNTLVLLAAPSEVDLWRLCGAAAAEGLRYLAFREPDQDDALTAVALEPAAGRLVARLPLALAHVPSLVEGR